MIDFSLGTAEQKARGLNIGLSPGVYAGKSSHQGALYVSESAFIFLESSIKRHSIKYAKPYSHWGITEISRQEWNYIISDWQQLKEDVAAATNAHELGVDLKELGREFNNGFEENKYALLTMIDQLIDWLHSTLRTHEQVSILGI